MSETEAKNWLSSNGAGMTTSNIQGYITQSVSSGTYNLADAAVMMIYR